MQEEDKKLNLEVEEEINKMRQEGYSMTEISRTLRSVYKKSKDLAQTIIDGPKITSFGNEKDIALKG